MIKNSTQHSPYSGAKIAYLRFPLDTLGEHFIYEEARHLKNYTPTVFCGLIKRADPSIDHFCYGPFAGLYHPKWPVFPSAHKHLYQEGMKQYLKEIKRKNIRILHAQFLTDAFFCFKLIKDSGLPLVVNLRGYDLFHPKADSFLKIVAPSVSKYVVKSKSMKDELAAKGVPEDMIEVNYGGIDIEKIVFKPRVPEQGKIRILTSGRFVDKKGYDTTLMFFKQVLTGHPDARLTVIGQGELEASIYELAEKLGIAESITFKKYLPHAQFIKELYAHNLCVLPSRTAKNGDKEGIPNVLKEAMASGMPVISTVHSGIPELVEDGVTGSLVAENDHAAMAQKFEAMLADPQLAFERCLNARFHVEKYFDVKQSARRMEKIYDYLLMPEFAKSSVDVYEGKRPSRFRVDLHLNKGCNSKCIMCDDWKNKLSTSFSREDISATYDSMKSFGVNHVRFHGQEPTLLDDFFGVIKEAKEKGFRVGLKTNALIFSTEKKVEKLKGVLDDLYLSIDSSHEDIHNEMRGNKLSYARNMYLAETIRKHMPDIPIYFNSVVTNKNYHSLADMMDLAKKMKANRVSFVHLSTNNKDDIDRLCLTKEEFEDFFFNVWVRILKKSIEYGIQVSVDPYFATLVALPLREQIKRLVGSPQDFGEEIRNFANSQYGKTFYSRNICYGILDHGTIDWNGDVFPCCAMPRSRDTAIGNILEHTYSEIWKSEKYVKHRESILRGECRYRNQCSRAFRQIDAYNNHFRNQLKSVGEPPVEDPVSQLKDSSLTQKYQFSKMLYYAVSKSDMYKKKFGQYLGANGKVDLQQLPYITKDEIKRHFPDKGAIPNYFEEDYGVYKTSSCGEKLFEYARPLRFNRFARMSTAFTHSDKWSPGKPWLKLTPLNCMEAQYASKTVSSGTLNDRHSSEVITIPPSDNYLAAPLAQIKECFEMIRKADTRLIHGNPNHLKTLLYRFHLEGLKLEGEYAVNSTYEILLPSTKRFLERYLKCAVHDQYGCSEVGPVSFRCSHGRNHIFADTVHVDVVPALDLNRPDIGRVVVTDLKNHVMPFVRYFNGDFAYVTKEERCTCGLKSPVMGDVIGREMEMIRHNDKVVFPLELDEIFNDLEHLLMYQIIYHNGEFTVKVVQTREGATINTDTIRSRFREKFDDAKLAVHIEETEMILPKSGGKYTNVIVDAMALAE